LVTSRNSRLPKIALAFASAIVFGTAIPSVAMAGTKPLVIAHRGGAALFPENTFPAFDNAVRLGADLLEFDMQMTADDQLVISHDGTVNASFCTAEPGSGAVAGPIRTLKLSEVLEFDCGSKHRALYPNQMAVPGTRMPTPDAFFARYKGAKVQFYGETKLPGPGEGVVDPVAFTRLVAAAVEKYGLEDRFILQSADYRTIDAMHDINPRIRTCLLYPWLAKTEYLQLAHEHHATCILLRLQDANAAEVRRLQEGGVSVFSDVVDDQASWRSYLDRGDNALFTNDPAALITFVKVSVGSSDFAPPHEQSTAVLKSRQVRDVVVLAHRGCWGEAPEVSIAAIEACKSLGADAVEIDVRKSRDGVLVLMHDDTVERTTNGTGAIADMPAAEIRKLRLKVGSGGPNAFLTNEHVPTLEQAFSVSRGQLLVNVHLKAPVEGEVAALVKRMKMVGQVTTWVTAGSDDASLVHSPLRAVVGIIPTINDCKLAYPAPCWPAQIRSLDSYAPIRPVAFFLDFRQSHEFIQAIASAPRPVGTRIFVETLNNEDKLSKEGRRAEWSWLIDAGVSVFMTNYPGELIELLKNPVPLPVVNHDPASH